MAKGVAVLNSREGVKGTIFFTQEREGVTTVTGTVSGLKPGLHGFHVHAPGDTTNGCMSTGPHFNPDGKQHGAPEDANRHVGDLGNIVVGDDGTATFTITDSQIPLTGPNSIVGRAVVVHADPDDLGKGVKSKHMFLWVPIVEMSMEEPKSKKIYFKTPMGIGKSFHVTAFMDEEEKHNFYLENPKK